MLNTMFWVILSPFFPLESIHFVRDGTKQQIRVLHPLWKSHIALLQYNILTNIVKSARIKVHFLTGFPTIGHRKIMSTFFGEI